MKIWFARDLNGTPSTWRYKLKKPTLCTFDGIWTPPDAFIFPYIIFNDSVITYGYSNTYAKFGRSFHGVRKGKIKLLDIPSKKRGTFIDNSCKWYKRRRKKQTFYPKYHKI